MIQYGKKEYIPQLKALWMEVFGDSEEYVNSFFDYLYREENVIVYVEKGEVVAALYMVQYHVGNGNTAAYLYALATKASARNRGIMSQLIRESQTISEKRGDQYQFLIPSEVSIQNYYKQFGFKVCECVTHGMLSGDEFKKKETYFQIQEEIMVNKGNFQKILAMRYEITKDKLKNTFFIDKVLM